MAIGIVVWKITETKTWVRGKEEVNTAWMKQGIRLSKLKNNQETRRNIIINTIYEGIKLTCDSTDHLKSTTLLFLWQDLVFLSFSATFTSKDVYLKMEKK